LTILPEGVAVSMEANRNRQRAAHEGLTINLRFRLTPGQNTQKE